MDLMMIVFAVSSAQKVSRQDKHKNMKKMRGQSLLLAD